MPAYLVEAPKTDVGTRFGKVNTVVVFAADEDDAKAMAKSQFDGDADASWDGATVTEVVAAADLQGWRLRVAVSGVAAPGVDVTVTGGAAATVDDLGTAMATALNATAAIDNAAYVGATNVLTIAGAADALGDKKVTAELLPPATLPGAKAIPGGIVSITDEGMSGDALSATLAADAFVIPNVAAQVQS